MSFFYFDNDNKIQEFSIKIGQKWNEEKINSHFLNSIFRHIDDGDKIVSENEYSKLDKIGNVLSNLINEKASSTNSDAELLKEFNNDKNLLVALKLSMGDYDILDKANNINVVEILKKYSELTGKKSIQTDILEQCFSGEISNDLAIERLCKISSLMFEYEDNYQNSNEMYTYFKNENVLCNYRNSQLHHINDYLEKMDILNYEIKVDPNLRKNMDNFQNKFKEKFGFEITDYALIKAQSYKFLSLKNLDFEAFSNSSDIENILYNIKKTSFNISEDSLLKEASFNNNSFIDRYSFDVSNSKIANLLQLSKDMREKDNKNYVVSNPTEKIWEIRNSSTGEVRFIDLNELMSNLHENQKINFENSFANMSNLMKWEFSKEINSKLNTTKGHGAAGEYFPETDEMGVSYSTDTYTLSHEIIHAMFATVIDGKNTFNEEINTKLVKTFEKEKAKFIKEEKLENCTKSDYSRYQYAAVNIHEFAAESGCLHLLGASTSQYTISKYFPESYKLVIEILENIRAQDTNRVLQKDV